MANTLVGHRGATDNLFRSVSCFTCKTVSSSSSSASFFPPCSSTGEFRVLDSVQNVTNKWTLVEYMFLASIFQLKSNLVIPVYHFENKHFTLFCRTTLEVYLYKSESGSDVASFGSNLLFTLKWQQQRQRSKKKSLSFSLLYKRTLTCGCLQHIFNENQPSCQVVRGHCLKYTH